MRAQHYANRLEEMVEDRTQEVLETNERFEAFMNIAPFRFAIYSPDDVLLEINDEGLRAFGPEVKREGVVGKSSLEIQPGIEKTKRYRIAHEVLQTGIPRYIEEDSALPQFGGISFSLWLFKVGPNIGSILLDITERKKMENSLRKSEETLRGFMDSSDEGYSIYDSELRLLELNGTALRRLPKGTKKENLIGKRIAEIYPGIESTQWYPVYLEVLRSGRTYHGEGRSVAIQGGLWLSASIFKVGEGLGVISRDISERKVLEERLHRAEVISAVEQMGATVAHDLRGPLGQVVQAVNMIKQDPNLTPRMLQIVEENAVRSLRMISDWRSSTRQILPQPIKTNFSDLVQHVLEGMTIPWNVEVVTTVGKGIEVVIDPDIMHRVLDNLIKNAIEAMPRGGKLLIDARREVDNVVISIGDTGVGISEESRKSIFSPLYTTKTGGMGLGLTYCRRAVETMGGSIDYQPEVGVGTTFTVTLPHKN